MRSRDVVIRPVEAKDVELVAAFLTAQLEQLFDNRSCCVTAGSIHQLTEEYLQPNNCNLWGVFRLDGSVAGTGGIRCYDNRIVLLGQRYRQVTTAEVVRCYIDIACRRQGLGAALFAVMTAFCRQAGYQMMYLHTHRFLPGGLAFWVKQGFAIIADEGGPLQTIHMEKTCTHNNIGCV